MESALAESHVREARPGDIVNGRVEQLLPFGAFIRLDNGADGYIPRRELTLSANVDPRHVLTIGQTLRAQVIEPATPGRRLELSLRRLEEDPWPAFAAHHRPGDVIPVTVKHVFAHGVLVEHAPGIDGYIPLEELTGQPTDLPERLLQTGDQTEAAILYIDKGQKRLWLSVRRWAERLATADKMVDRLVSDDRRIEMEPLSDESALQMQLEAGEPAALGAPILIVEDQAEVRCSLLARLQNWGYAAEAAASAAEALELCARRPYALAIIDLDMPAVTGLELIARLGERGHDLPIAVMSVPDLIAREYERLRALGVVLVYDKLAMDDVHADLQQLARGERPTLPTMKSTDNLPDEVTGFRALAAAVRAESGAPERLRRGLARLRKSLKADTAVIFRLDPAARAVAIVAQSGNAPLDPENLYRLPESPVKDVILEGDVLWRNRVSSDRGGRFRNLLALLPFESCIGIPLEMAGRVEHALFLFAARPEVFNAACLREATAAAILFQSVLESQLLDERVFSVGQLLLTGELASTITHEVGNKRLTLDSQIANARVALARAAAEPDELTLIEVDRWLNEMAVSVDGLRNTTANLVRLKDAREEQLVDIPQAIRQAERQLALEAQRQGVLIRLQTGEGLPPAAANPNRLQHVFLNLMLNAIQWTAALPGRKGRLRVVAAETEIDGAPWIRVRFADNGPGIHRDLWDKVFELGETTREGGSGLGLYIARSLIESMGGRVCVEESLMLLGTTFVVELPAARLS